MKKNPLYPSRLRSRAEFLRRTVTVEHGISKERWETVFTCWCGVEPLSGREFWEAAAINREAVDGTLPRVTLFLDLPHEESLRRRYGASAPDRMELESGAFHARVEEAFRRLVAEDPDRFVVLDATLPAEEIARQASEAVIARLCRAEEEADRP